MVMPYPQLWVDKEESLRRVCRVACAGLGVSRVALLRREGEAFEVLTSYPKGREGDWSWLGAVCSGEEIRVREAVIVGEGGEMPEGVGFVAAVPIVGQGTATAVMVFVDESSRRLGGEERGLIEDLAAMASEVLQGETTAESQGRREKRLRRERREGQEKIDALERSNRQLEQFAYVASHDLQEPLRMVTGFLGLLKEEYEEALDEEAGEYIEYAVDGARRMKEMIDGLLTYSRIWSGSEPFEEVDLGEVYEDVAVEVERGGRGQMELVRGRLPTVWGRAGQLRRLVTNLVSNAIEHSGTDPKVEVGWEERESEYCFWVADQGVGIAEAQQERIFDIFVRGNREAKSGSGIGLAISKAIVEEHGGRIWVESSEGKGATFYFTLMK